MTEQVCVAFSVNGMNSFCVGKVNSY